MDIKQLILNKIKNNSQIKVSEIARETGFSRAYISRFFKALKEEGKIVQIGKANLAHYVPANKALISQAQKRILSVHKKLANRNLSEDIVLEQIKKQTGIFISLPENVNKIASYGFTEMLNNAIEHSRSKEIEIKMSKDKETINFDVVDRGIGIFNNIRATKKLSSEMEAIQDLLKGKQTTAPALHTGEGIFFTSKLADILIIQSSGKKLIFNNLLDDVFIDNAKEIKGTRVHFSLSIKAKRDIGSVFRAYTDKFFEFSKTRVLVRLYKLNQEYISRSQARRIFAGLEKFKEIILDFKNVSTVGQAFADEVFRVWQTQHPNIRIESKNANENVAFMINKAKS